MALSWVAAVFSTPMAAIGAFMTRLNKCRPLWFVALAFFAPTALSANTVYVGVASFDNLIPAGPGPGVNVFNIFNYTGDPGSGGFALPPDFPVFTNLTFLNSSLTLDDGISPFTVFLGDIGPGQLNPSEPVQFPDTTNFLSATLTATLSQTSLALFDSSIFNAFSPTLTVQILPSSGPFLQAGTDFAVISVSDAPSVPEPGTVLLTFLGILAVAAVATYKTRRPI
jgi:hypothetical protein